MKAGNVLLWAIAGYVVLKAIEKPSVAVQQAPSWESTLVSEVGETIRDLSKLGLANTPQGTAGFAGGCPSCAAMPTTKWGP